MNDELPRGEPGVGDAFGAALRRCWDAGGSHGVAWEIIERDDGYVGVGDVARYFTPPHQLRKLDQHALSLATGRVLDVGCGAGRHALALQEAALDVVGIDASPGAVDVARARGLHAALGSATDLPPAIGSFDTLLLLGNNLGLLSNVSQAPAVLTQLASVARPGAQLIGAGRDPYSDDPDHRSYHQWNRHRGRLPGQARIRIRDRRVATPWFDYLLATPDELAELTSSTPWRIENVITEQQKYLAVLTLETE